MFEKLDAYLEEISHFLSGRTEREEILSEIKSHILEKAEQEFGEVTPEALVKVISTYGPARRVAEKYLEGRAIIAPAYRRYLFRYTALLASLHTLLAVMAVVFKKTFVIFPVVFMPQLGVADLLMYLPAAYLADLGFVSLILFFLTQSGKEIRLPWPKLSVDIDEVKPRRGLAGDIIGFVLMAALSIAALIVFFRHGTIFFVNLDFIRAKPLLTPAAGQWFSLALIGLWLTETVRLLVRFFVRSPWVDVVRGFVSLLFVAMMVSRPVSNIFAVPLPEWLAPHIRLSVTITLFIIAFFTALDFIKSLVIALRKRLAAKAAPSRS